MPRLGQLPFMRNRQQVGKYMYIEYLPVTSVKWVGRMEICKDETRNRDMKGDVFGGCKQAHTQK